MSRGLVVAAATVIVGAATSLLHTLHGRHVERRSRIIFRDWLRAEEGRTLTDLGR